MQKTLGIVLFLVGLFVPDTIGEDTRKEFLRNQIYSSFNEEMLDSQTVQRQNLNYPYHQERLPKDVVPEKYHLWIKPNTAGKTDFCGEVKIDLKCVHSTKYIILHSKDLNITSYGLYKQGSSKQVLLPPMKTNPKYDQILFEAKSSLVSGQKYELFIAFSGHMKDADIKANTYLLTGFFRRSYIKKDGSRK